MLKSLFIPVILLLFLFDFQPNIESGVDEFWAEISRTVVEGDLEGMAALYHEDAVLVYGANEVSYPIATALDNWKQGLDDTAAGNMTASVEFRFSQRIHGETTAHDTGIFCYKSQMDGEEPETSYVHFQGLLIKKEGEWKMTMEYQVAAATEEEWETLE